MKLTRRNFLAWAGLGAVGAVACEGFGIRHGEFDLQSPVLLPEDLVKGNDNWYATLCRNCSSGEGIVVRVMEGRAKKVEGNPLYPINHGKHGPSCEAALQALYHPDRITGPLQRSGPRESGQFAPLSWPDALDNLRQQLVSRGNDSLLVTEPLRGHMSMLVNRFAGALGGRHMGFEVLDNSNLPRRHQRRIWPGPDSRLRLGAHQVSAVIWRRFLIHLAVAYSLELGVRRVSPRP